MGYCKPFLYDPPSGISMFNCQLYVTKYMENKENEMLYSVFCTINLFIQVNITQDSLDSFLKVADKLKIKGLCERGTLIPEGPPFHNTITIPLKVVLIY